jgi:hypothetical protein
MKIADLSHNEGQEMQVIEKIDQLTSELSALKSELSNDQSTNAIKFNDLLKSKIDTSYTVTGVEGEVALSTNAKNENRIPSWVDLDYGYDPQNPRKPNMRELMEAISEKRVEDLYTEIDSNWQKISSQASDILYGVVGSNKDTRDWLSIMSSKDILTQAREQTGAMYEPKADIQSHFDEDGILTEQTAIIKDNKGNVLRSLSNNIASAEETLLNFGATKQSIPTNLEEKIDPEKFDKDLLAFLKNFDMKPTSIQQVVVQSASEVIANKISQEIPLDELAKL